MPSLCLLASARASCTADATRITFPRAEHCVDDAALHGPNPCPLPERDPYDAKKPWTSDALPEHRTLQRVPPAVLAGDGSRCAGVVALQWRPPVPSPASVSRYLLQVRGACRAVWCGVSSSFFVAPVRCSPPVLLRRLPQ